jgi:hypothetical protein
MEPPSPEDDSDEEDSAEDDSEEPTVPLGSGRLDLEEVAFSLRAQPVPLKWTAGTANVFFNGPPHLGQIDGPSAWTERMTSTSWPQLEQT